MTDPQVQLLFLFMSGMFAVLFFAIKSWISKVDTKIDLKVNETHCHERNEKIKEDCKTLFKHQHASSGELIIKQGRDL